MSLLPKRWIPESVRTSCCYKQRCTGFPCVCPFIDPRVYFSKIKIMWICYILIVNFTRSFYQKTWIAFFPSFFFFFLPQFGNNWFINLVYAKLAVSQFHFCLLLLPWLSSLPPFQLRRLLVTKLTGWPACPSLVLVPVCYPRRIRITLPGQLLITLLPQ